MYLPAITCFRVLTILGVPYWVLTIIQILLFGGLDEVFLAIVGPPNKGTSNPIPPRGVFVGLFRLARV